MGVFTIMMIFSMVWWLLFFMILPVGNKMVEKPQAGHSTGAPENPRIRKKVKITTLASVLLTAIVYILISEGVIARVFL